jgi:hypothetical protein
MIHRVLRPEKFFIGPLKNDVADGQIDRQMINSYP